MANKSMRMAWSAKTSTRQSFSRAKQCRKLPEKHFGIRNKQNLRSVSATRRKGPLCSRSPSTHMDANSFDRQSRAKAAAVGQLLHHPQPFEVIERQRHMFADAPLADERQELVLIVRPQVM